MFNIFNAGCLIFSVFRELEARSHGGTGTLSTRTALQNTRAIDMHEFKSKTVFLSNLGQILTSCRKMNVRSAQIYTVNLVQ